MAALVDTQGRPLRSTKPMNRAVYDAAMRAFAAAQGGRLLGSWRGNASSLNADLQTDLAPLRNRSRELTANNAYARRFIQGVKQNVIGPNPVAFQAQAKRDDRTLDEQDNERIEDAYRTAGEVGNYDVTGRLSRADGERLLIETVARDGETLVRFIKGADNPTQFAVQFLDIERLDLEFNRSAGRDGNRIVMGVEINGWGKPVAYHIHAGRHPGDLSNPSGSERRERVPAEDILHAFLPMRAEQQRGVPWMHAAMIELHHLGGYKEAAVVASRVGAAKMGWFRGMTGEIMDGDAEDERGNVLIDAEPGTFGQLKDDAELVEWNPDYPHQQFSMFNKACLQGIAAGFGASYPTFAQDLEGVNYSSMRGGVQDERDGYMILQDWVVGAYHRRWYAEWIKYQLIAKAIDAIRPLPAFRLAKYLSVQFQPRRWGWVDPLKDEQAIDMSLNNNSKTLFQVIRARGEDPMDVLRENARIRDTFESLGLPLPAYLGGSPASEPAPPVSVEGDPDA